MKEIISAPRQAGKTYTMLQRMREDPNGVMVCISRSEAQRLAQENRDIEAWRFISWEQAREGLCLAARQEWTRYYVDNLDIILRMMFRHPIEVASVNVTPGLTVMRAGLDE